MTMRTSPIILLVWAALSTAGCIAGETALIQSRSRADCHNRSDTGRDSGTAQETVVDTAILFSAVRFEESYNFHKDSAYGADNYEIIFYRDFEPSLSIPSSAECASPDPDTHHIVGGHLYTEAVSRERTFVGRDGQTLFSFEGREILRGLLPDGDDIYTLSESRSGDGFSFRKNGKILFSRESGYVFGDMSEPSYGPSGALYRDMGKICFCYAARLSGTERYFTVKDGEAEMTSLEEKYGIQDVKIDEGYAIDASSSCLWFDVEEGRVWRDGEGHLSISGHMSYCGGTPVAAVVTDDDPDRLNEICEGYAVIYHGRRRDIAINETASGSIGIYSSESAGAVFSSGDFQLMSPSCAAMVGDRELCAALTSRSGDAHRVLCGDRQEELRLHGYLSCIRAEVSVSQTR